MSDLDRDGDLDLLDARGNRFLNDGTGRFGTAVQITNSGNATAPEVIDLDLDGTLDLVRVNGSTTTWQRGLGNGAFVATPTTFGGTPLADEHQFTDLDGDGRVDFVYRPSGSPTNQTLAVAYGQAAGGWASPVTLGNIGAFTFSFHAIAIRNFGGDAKPDVVAGGRRFIQGATPRTFTVNASAFPFGWQTFGDFNGDGYADLLGAATTAADVRVALNDGAGNFALAASFPANGREPKLRVADADGDGDADFVAVDNAAGTATLYRNAGTGMSFAVAVVAGGVPSTGSDVALGIGYGDADGDGRADLLYATSTGVAWRAGRADGTFAPALAATIDGYYKPSLDRYIDVDRNGTLDAVGQFTQTNGSVVTRLFIAYSTPSPAAVAAPVVLATELDLEHGAPVVRVRFSLDVSASLAAADLSVMQRPSGPVGSAASVTYDAASGWANFTLPATLVDGDYRATIARTTVTGPTGVPLAADLTFDFFLLAGDANRDRAVNFDDLLVVAQNYGRTGQNYAQGDFNDDGIVGFDDLLLLSQHYGTSLAVGDDVVVAVTPARRTRRLIEDVLPA